jgi:hypothetical protein
VDRRRFDHLFEELSVGLGRLAPRYALWLHMGEAGLDPERLSRADATRFCRLHLSAFLGDHGLALKPRQRRRVERAVARFDPSLPTPYDHMARLGGVSQRRP